MTCGDAAIPGGSEGPGDGGGEGAPAGDVGRSLDRGGFFPVTPEQLVVLHLAESTAGERRDEGSEPWVLGPVVAFRVPRAARWFFEASPLDLAIVGFHFAARANESRETGSRRAGSLRATADGRRQTNVSPIPRSLQVMRACKGHSHGKLPSARSPTGCCVSIPRGNKDKEGCPTARWSSCGW